MIKIHDNGNQVEAILIHDDIELLSAYGDDENKALESLKDEVKTLTIALIETDWNETMFIDGDGRPLSKFNNKG